MSLLRQRYRLTSWPTASFQMSLLSKTLFGSFAYQIASYPFRIESCTSRAEGWHIVIIEVIRTQFEAFVAYRKAATTEVTSRKRIFGDTWRGIGRNIRICKITSHEIGKSCCKCSAVNFCIGESVVFPMFFITISGQAEFASNVANAIYTLHPHPSGFGIYLNSEPQVSICDHSCLVVYPIYCRSELFRFSRVVVFFRQFLITVYNLIERLCIERFHCGRNNLKRTDASGSIRIFAAVEKFYAFLKQLCEFVSLAKVDLLLRQSYLLCLVIGSFHLRSCLSYGDETAPHNRAKCHQSSTENSNFVNGINSLWNGTSAPTIREYICSARNHKYQQNKGAGYSKVQPSALVFEHEALLWAFTNVFGLILHFVIVPRYDHCTSYRKPNAN